MSRNGIRHVVAGLALLAGMVLGSLPAAAQPQPCPGDYNGSGQNTVDDLNLFFEVWFALPTADFNDDGVIDEDDVHAFLDAYHAGLPSADINGDGQVTVQDLFDFLAKWNLVTGNPSTDYDGDGVIVNDTGDIYAFIDAWSQTC